MIQMPKFGDRMFDKAIGNAARGKKEPEITEVEVVRVGRKYFTCQSLDRLGELLCKHLDIEYYIDQGTYKQNTGYCQDHALYPSRQAILDESEMYHTHDNLRLGVFGGSRPQLSLRALREISEIVKRDKESPSDV